MLGEFKESSCYIDSGIAQYRLGSAKRHHGCSLRGVQWVRSPPPLVSRPSEVPEKVDTKSPSQNGGAVEEFKWSSAKPDANC